MNGRQRLQLRTAALIATSLLILGTGLLGAQVDRLNPEATQWDHELGMTVEQILLKMADGYRPIDLEFSTTSTFDVVFVANTDSRASWFFAGFQGAIAGAQQIVDQANALQARPTDIEIFPNAAGNEWIWAVIYEPIPPGENWAIRVGDSVQGAIDFGVNNDFRIIDIEVTDAGEVPGFPFGVHSLYHSNTGASALPWAILVGATPTQMTDYMINNNARMIDLERRGSVYDAVFVPWNVTFRWYIGESTPTPPILSQVGHRLIDLEFDPSGGTWSLISIQNWLFKDAFESGDMNRWSATNP